MIEDTQWIYTADGLTELGLLFVWNTPFVADVCSQPRTAFIRASVLESRMEQSCWSNSTTNCTTDVFRDVTAPVKCRYRCISCRYSCSLVIVREKIIMDISFEDGLGIRRIRDRIKNNYLKLVQSKIFKFEFQVRWVFCELNREYKYINVMYIII